MRKVLDGLAVASFLLSAAVLGGGVYGYFWITSEDTQDMLKEEAINAVKSSLPIPGGLTGPAMPAQKPGKSAGGLGLPSF
jgi:hypothetical protein